MKETKYVPRNDMVLIRKVKRDRLRGIIIPDIAQEGSVTIVEACGPDVKDGAALIGKIVLAIGTPGQDLVRIPGTNDMYLTRQGNVLVSVEEGTEE